MKTILAPTDFSDTASNAINYAVEIAKLSGAKLVLFHVYSVPIIPVETSMVITADEVEKDAMHALRELAREIHLKNGKELIVECVCRFGSSVKEINYFADEHQSDLIVMGIEGSSAYLTEKIIGSTTTAVIKKSRRPVMAIDKNVKYRSIKKIALACDYHEMKNPAPINFLKELTALFQSKLFVINVVNELQPVSDAGKDIAAMKLEQMLGSCDHISYPLENEDVIEGINHFVDDKAIDMVVMIPQKHSVLKNLFNASHTKRMAFHSKVPLLTLQE
jgi:nucleotide-binding universal stress UspA family protein